MPGYGQSARDYEDALDYADYWGLGNVSRKRMRSIDEVNAEIKADEQRFHLKMLYKTEGYSARFRKAEADIQNEQRQEQLKKQEAKRIKAEEKVFDRAVAKKRDLKHANMMCAMAAAVKTVGLVTAQKEGPDAVPLAKKEGWHKTELRWVRVLEHVAKECVCV